MNFPIWKFALFFAPKHWKRPQSVGSRIPAQWIFMQEILQQNSDSPSHIFVKQMKCMRNIWSIHTHVKRCIATRECISKVWTARRTCQSLVGFVCLVAKDWVCWCCAWRRPLWLSVMFWRWEWCGFTRLDYVYGLWPNTVSNIPERSLALLHQSSYTAMSLNASQTYFYGCRACGYTSRYYDVSISHRWQVRISFHSHAKLLSFLEPWFYWRRWSECTRPVHFPIFYGCLWDAVSIHAILVNIRYGHMPHVIYRITVSRYPYWRHWMISDCSRHRWSPSWSRVPPGETVERLQRLRLRCCGFRTSMPDTNRSCPCHPTGDNNNDSTVM